MDGQKAEINKIAENIAQGKGCVLIQGESGTGKTFLAKAIHEQSGRLGPVLTVNCAQTPEMLLETEVFGFEKGAFAGTVSEKRGKFEQASGGTLILENVSELTPKLQAKILKVIENGAVERIGAKHPITIDVRVIATTSKNIAELSKDGKFNENLYYRLSASQLVLPPLRERADELNQIVENMLTRVTGKYGRRVSTVDAEAIAKMQQYPFPGNLKELETVLERAAHAATDGIIRSEDVILGAAAASRHQGVGAHSTDWEAQAQWAPGRTLDEIERAVILKSLAYHNGNRTHTARELGISIRTLRNKLNEYRKIGIDV
jgi:two-component system response regulator FlrC